MSRDFSPFRPKIRVFNISGVRKEFLRAIGKGYTIKAPTSQKNFYTLLDLSNEILVNVEAMRTGLTFPLNPFVVSYFNSSGLTLVWRVLEEAEGGCGYSRG